MPNKRTGYAPWSLTREAGVQSATVEGTIEVPQNVQPTLSTGFVDEKGNWQGTKSSDEVFYAFTKHVAVPNSGETLSPATANRSFINMSGFRTLQFAIKPTNGGNYAIKAVMGPDTESYANLNPVNPAATIRIAQSQQGTNQQMTDAFVDTESCTADVWNIFTIQGRVAGQKLLQLMITNSSGGESTIEVAFMRLV